MILWKLGWNSIWKRRGRTLLTVMSIAAGVAAVVAVLQATADTRGRLRQLHEAVASRAALEVVAADNKPFDEQLAQPIAGVAGVRAAVGSLRQFTTAFANQNRVRGIVMGVDFELYRLVHDFEIVAGVGHAKPGDACLEASVAERLGIAPGGTIRLLTRSSIRLVSLKVTGVIRLQGASALEETAAVFLPLAETQRLWRARRMVDRVQVLLDHAGESERIAAEISQRLPDTLVVRKVASRADLSAGIETLVNQGLGVAAALSIIAATFIVLNTFMMSVTERQKQFALMRIVGTTSQQIRALLLRESLLLSVLGTAVGVGFGLGGGRLLTLALESLFRIDQAPAQSWMPVLCGLAFGPLLTLVAVAYPAEVVRRTAPLAILWPTPVPTELRRFRVLFLAAATGLAVSIAVLAAAIFDRLPAEVSIPGVSLAVLSCVLFVPTLLRPASYVVFRLVRGVLPVEALLARAQIIQNMSRSTLTIGVLFVVTCTGIAVGSTMLAVVHDVESWYERTIVWDYLLRASAPRIDVSESEPVPSDVEGRLRAIPGIASIDRVTFASVEVNGEPALLLVRDFSLYDGLPLDLKEGDSSEVRRQLLAGEAVVGSVLARLLRVSIGDTATIEMAGASRAVRIAGIVGEYTSSGSVAEMDRQAAERVFPITEIHGFMIKCEPNSATQVGDAIASLARERGLLYQSLADFRQVIRAMLSGITSGMWLLLALSLLVAAFGIVNTLTVNVLEQTRYIGLLRVIGMTRAQVRNTIRCQALMIGLLALVPGAALGAILALVITYLFRALFGHAIVFEARPLLLGTYVLVGLVLVIAAAAIPAWRAAWMSPLEAIHDE